MIYIIELRCDVLQAAFHRILVPASITACVHVCTPQCTYFYFFSQDRDGTLRVTGEEWLVKKTGAYLPGAYEEVVDTVGAFVLNDKVQCIIVYFLKAFWAGALPQ